MHAKRFLGLALLFGLARGQVLLAEDRDLCLYTDAAGALKQVTGRGSVPQAYQAQAHCIGEKRSAKNSQPRKIWEDSAVQATPAPKLGEGSNVLAAPEDIKLKGNIRREDMSSPLGRIELRWPRKVELLFGKVPLRAMQDAALAVSRALKTGGFPAPIQSLNLDWKVVFMDEEVPETQIPTYLVNNCHPAWMTPPANLYVVAQRVVAGCGGNSSQVSHQVADSQLAHILIHEMGHAIEAQILGPQMADDRMRAEGFASWFEAYGSDFSTVIQKGSVKRFYKSLALQSLQQSPDRFNFQGSANDYARASMYFHALAAKRGVRGVMDVYETMTSQRLNFFSGIKARMGWDSPELEAQVRKVVLAAS
ncbi:MAG: hypothetical protein K1X79_08460 [Oligoflexia bacterium]|nr:hypothetical protein [Oligoflexia bacterium]